jgi:class 3 adenylate cyclase
MPSSDCQHRYPFKKSGLFLLLALAIFSKGYGQGGPERDSLEERYLRGGFAPSDSLEVLKSLTYIQTEPDKILQYSNALIEVSERQDSLKKLFNGYLQKGNALRLKGDFALALENYFTAANVAIEDKSDANLGSAYITIADVYSVMDNPGNASSYYNKGIRILRQAGDSLGFATALSNAGDEYYKQGKLDSALMYFEESGPIFEKLKFQTGTGYYLGSVGMVYSAQGKEAEALEKLNQSVSLLKGLNDYYGVSAFLPFISEIYERRGDVRSALRYTEESLKIAREYGLKEQIADASLKLSELYESKGEPAKSLSYYKAYTAYKDSISNVPLVQEMAKLRTDFEVTQKQSEVDLLEKEAEIQRLKERRQQIVIYVIAGILILAFLLALALYKRYTYIKKTRDIIEREKARSDSLLRNILPEEMAEELKENGRVRAKRFESVTVLFADFVGFTQFSENMSPEDLVHNVDFYFSKFDEIVEKYGLEKIKTMGDCYMCAGGLPFPSEDHAVKMVRIAREFIQFAREIKKGGQLGITGFDIRIGINTGPVVAGVVGTKKFAYDVWGDTVNIASRMESNSAPGSINISEDTYQLIKDVFPCEFRGMVQVKNKGMMKMYFVKATGADEAVA